MTFTGDFDSLPIRARILFGALPTHPTSADFAGAVSDLASDEPAAHWRVEAIRWRLAHPGVELDVEAINRATAARLYALLA